MSTNSLKIVLAIGIVGWVQILQAQFHFELGPGVQFPLDQETISTGGVAVDHKIHPVLNIGAGYTYNRHEFQIAGSLYETKTSINRSEKSYYHLSQLRFLTFPVAYSYYLNQSDSQFLLSAGGSIRPTFNISPLVYTEGVKRVNESESELFFIRYKFDELASFVMALGVHVQIYARLDNENALILRIYAQRAVKSAYSVDFAYGFNDPTYPREISFDSGLAELGAQIQYRFNLK